VPILSITHQDSMQSRVQKTIGRKNQITGLFAFQDTRADNPTIFNFLDTSSTLGINSNANWMHRLTQRMFMTTGVQYSRYAARTTPFFANRVNVSGEAGINGNYQSPAYWGPPSLTFASAITGLSDTNPSFTRNQTAGVSESIFWSHGSHNLTFGGDFRRQEFNLLQQQNPRGSFAFTGAATRATVNGEPNLETGSDFADFLLGIPDTSAIAFGNADKYFRESVYDAYFTDDWRVSPSLTINAGGRWEYSAPITELYGRLVNLDIASGYSAIAPVVGSDPLGPLTGQQYPSSLVRPDKHAIQPRIGISWRPFLASSMVIRSGYGVYYNTSFYLPIATFMAQQSPLSKTLSVQNSPQNPLTLANPFQAPPNVVTNTFAVDPNFLDGYAQNWYATLQRDLPGSLVMIATYTGVKGTRAQQAFYPNSYAPGTANPCPACPSGYTFLTSNGNSTRESGQFQLRRRLHNGITAQAQYTFSKSIDDAALGGRSTGGSVIAQNWLDLSAERSLSNFDQRHLLNLSAQYTSGMGLGGGTLMGGWKGPLLKDWTFVAAINAGSGLPLTPIYLESVPGTGATGVRPDYTGASIYAAPPGLHLNPAAVAPPLGHWGDAGRNSITGPDTFTMNASMARTFRVSDRVSTDLRFDANNVLNHVTYPSWNTTVDGPLFGLPTAANTMRTMQVTLRARF
jgi:trimeric autotransporter adhesin